MIGKHGKIEKNLPSGTTGFRQVISGSRAHTELARGAKQLGGLPFAIQRTPSA
jgi:hypothetical protein